MPPRDNVLSLTRRTQTTGAVESAAEAKRTFEALYRQFFPRVFNYVCYRVPDEATAQDLTSAIFEKALRKMTALQSLDAFAAWIFRIAHNTVTDYYRCARHARDVSLESVPEAQIVGAQSDSPERSTIQQETFVRLQRYLRSLSQREQEIVALKFAAGLNNRQIGAAIGETPGNVGTILYRTMRKLRDKMSAKANITHFDSESLKSLKDAQAQVTFQILQPSYLPDGYSFAGVIVHDFGDPFAVPPRIILLYQNQDNPKGSIFIDEFKAKYKIDEAVAPGYSQEIKVSGRQAFYVRGHWECDDDGTYQDWKSDAGDRLLYEIDNIVIWMQASPPLGADELTRIAESLQ